MTPKDDEHLLPQKDIKPHVRAISCWCCPVYTDGKYYHRDLKDRAVAETIDELLRKP